MFTIGVKDFGPIKEGILRLRPFTVLVGPNNAGKSYFALLTYALSGASGRLPPQFRHRPFFIRRLSYEPSVHLSQQARAWLIDQSKSKVSPKIKDFPDDAREAVYSAIGKALPRLVAGLGHEIQRCFAAKLQELATTGTSNGFRLRFEQTSPNMTLGIALRKKQLRLVDQDWDVSDETIDLSELRHIAPAHLAQFLDEFLPAKVMESLFQGLSGSAYYFPAARSGILQGHKALASSIVSRSPLVGIEPFEIPTLSGVLADFIGNLLRLERRRADRKVAAVARFLEEDACKGKVDLGATDNQFEYPEIYYELAGTKLPLHRTSSMVSEIAPIILFLKYVVEDTDTLIIEEPEAHLHPDNQRTLATALVRLVRLGVRVMITTHSEYLLHQVSNFIRLDANRSLGEKLGYRADDRLSPEEVGAYLFCSPKGRVGTVVQELQVTPEDGIPEFEFVKIAEAIYDETLKIERLGRPDSPDEECTTPSGKSSLTTS
jgi:hypothetical protein